jgi:hypothetical protein
MSGHTEGDEKDKFCSLRADTCNCGEKYREHCDAEASAWEAAAAGSSSYVQRYGPGARRRSHEAHHIACVAAVTGIITTNGDIDSIVRATVWCVNRKNNMIALPLWPHTIEWYFSLSDRALKAAGAAGQRAATVQAPPFADLAHHDYDHGEYIKDVNADLKSIAQQVEEAADEHTDPTGNLAGALDGVVTKYKATLQGRGTHGAWQLGMNDATGTSDWYKAFSMTKSNPTPRAFPAPSNYLWQKMLDVASAFLKL